MKNIIVSRHEGAIEWLARRMTAGGSFAHVVMVRGADGAAVERVVLWDYSSPDFPEGVALGEWRVLAEATPDDVRGNVIWGNLPLDLASAARWVMAVVFPPGKAPRGRDYGPAEMDAAGAQLRRFAVLDDGEVQMAMEGHPISL